MEEMKKLSLICEKCGGVLQVDADKEVVACPYCGNKTLILESDEVTKERIRTSAQKEVELERLKVEDRERQRVLEKEQKQEKEQHAEQFKKSKWNKWLIIAFLIAALCAYYCFSKGGILAGILAVIKAGCFGVAWAMGMQIIKEKRHYIHILIALVGLVLIIPTFRACSSVKDQKDVKEVKWSIIVLGEEIPEPVSKKLEIHTNTSKELWIDVVETDEEAYYEYIEACKTAGYTVSPEESSIGYEAYNAEGYFLRLSKYGSQEEMSIHLETEKKEPEETKEMTEETQDVIVETPAPSEVVESDKTIVEEPEVTEAPISTATPENDDNSIDPEFKEMMDEYEAFFDEYIEYINKLNNADSMDALELMVEYADYLEQYASAMEKMEAIDEEELNTAEALYYAEVSARIYQKLAKIE